MRREQRAVLYAHYMPPSPSASATRMSSLALHLRKQGCVVEMLTSQPGSIQSGELQITRCNGRAGLIWWLFKNPRCSILVSSPPATPAAEVAFFARLFGYRVIVDIRDPYVSEAIETGDLKPGLTTSIKYRLEKSLFRSAHVVSAVSDFLADALRRSMDIEPRKLVVAPNGVELRVFAYDASQREAVRSQLGVGNAPLFVYAGILGGKELDQVFSALADSLKAGAYLLLIGVVDEFSLPIKLRLQEQATQLGISQRVFWQQNLPLSEVSRFLSAADIGINPLPLKRAYCLPVKTYEYMACGLYNLCHAPAGGGLASLIDKPELGTVQTTWSNFAEKARELSLHILSVREGLKERINEAGKYSRSQANDVLTRELLKATS